MTDTSALAQALLSEIREATRDGLGVTRESYGEGETAALRILEDRAEDLGLSHEWDRAGNLWLSLPEENRTEPYVVVGSHADSVPQGGNFDGLAGIVAGMLMLLQLRGRHEQAPHCACWPCAARKAPGTARPTSALCPCWASCPPPH
jgi:N-carbamoyl-L-amino-acid hydrolase